MLKQAKEGQKVKLDGVVESVATVETAAGAITKAVVRVGPNTVIVPVGDDEAETPSA